MESQMKEGVGGIKVSTMRRWSAEVPLFLSSADLTTPWVSRPMGWPECLGFRGMKREGAVGWPVLPSLPCLGLPTMGWPSSGAPRVYLGAVGWPVPPGRLPSWGGSMGWPGSRPARGPPTMGWPGWGALLTRGPVGWPGSPLVPGNSLGHSLHPDRVKNTLGGSLWPDRGNNTLEDSLHPERVDKTLEHSLGIKMDNSLEHSLGTKMEPNLTFKRVASETAKVEHKLPLSQQVGGTRREVTDVARRGTRGTKAATRRQSNSPRSSPSGKMQLTSKHRQRMRPRENRTQDGTWTDSKSCKFTPFLAPFYKTLIH